MIIGPRPRYELLVYHIINERTDLTEPDLDFISIFQPDLGLHCKANTTWCSCENDAPGMEGR